jgi:pimeloyl-ACP methyl ester carboxylesterase
MSTYALIHGAGGDSWYWHLVAPQLRERGHKVVAVDLPCDDDSAGLAEYAQCVVDAVGSRQDVIVVAQSLGGFAAPLVCGRLPVSLVVLVNAMVPSPGEPPGGWWANTGHVFPDPFDPAEAFAHDLPDDLAAELATRIRTQSGAVFDGPSLLSAWPDLPTRVLVSRDDRFFPADFQRRVARERLGLTPDELPGGHLPALGHPDELVEWLERYRNQVSGGGTGP